MVRWLEKSSWPEAAAAWSGRRAGWATEGRPSSAAAWTRGLATGPGGRLDEIRTGPCRSVGGRLALGDRTRRTRRRSGGRARIGSMTLRRSSRTRSGVDIRECWWPCSTTGACLTRSRRGIGCCRGARAADRESTGWRELRPRPGDLEGRGDPRQGHRRRHPVADRCVAAAAGGRQHWTARRGPDPVPEAGPAGAPRRLLGQSRAGRTALHAGEPGEAVRYYQAALAIRPGAGVVYNNLGLARRPGRNDEAVEQFGRPCGSTRRRPRPPQPRDRLDDLGRHDEAIEQTRIALRIDPKSARAPPRPRLNLEAKGRHDEALDEYRRAVALEPKDALPAKDLRTVLIRHGTGWRRRGPPGRRPSRAEPARARRLVRVRRVMPVPRPGGRIPPCPQGLAPKFGDEHRPVRRGADRPGLSAPARVGGRTASDRHPRRACLGLDRVEVPGPLSPLPVPPRAWRNTARADLDRAIAAMRGDASRVLGPAPRLVLAMALHRDGQTAEARKTLAAAVLSYDWRATRVQDQDGWIYHVAPPRGRSDDPAEPAGIPGREVPAPGQRRATRPAGSLPVHGSPRRLGPSLCRSLRRRPATGRRPPRRPPLQCRPRGRPGRLRSGRRMRPGSANRSGDDGGSRRGNGCGRIWPPGARCWTTR